MEGWDSLDKKEHSTQISWAFSTLSRWLFSPHPKPQDDLPSALTTRQNDMFSICLMLSSMFWEQKARWQGCSDLSLWLTKSQLERSQSRHHYTYRLLFAMTSSLSKQLRHGSLLHKRLPSCNQSKQARWCISSRQTNFMTRNKISFLIIKRRWKEGTEREMNKGERGKETKAVKIGAVKLGWFVWMNVRDCAAAVICVWTASHTFFSISIMRHHDKTTDVFSQEARGDILHSINVAVK